MEEDIKKAPILPIGNKKYICVEYPGNVKNVNRALETFGGEKAITQFYDSVKKNQSDSKDKNDIYKPIELRYRPKDPYCHPIEGNVVPTNRLLLKVTRRRKKDQPEEEEEEVKTEVLGIIPYTCRFRNMADFQYIVPKSNRMDQLRTSIVNGNVNKLMNYKPNLDNDDIELESTPPPLFSTINMPFNYDYKQNAQVVRIQVEQPDGTYVTKLVTKRQSAPKLITSASFEQEDIPKKPKFELPPLEKNALPVKEKILKLFEKRPVWFRHALRAQLEPSERVHLLNVLLHVGYTFSNGPWRECWVKYGVEVRHDVKYNIYQQLDSRTNLSNERKTFVRGQNRVLNSLTMPEQEKSNKEMDDTNNDTHYIFDGKEVITRTSLFQLCDITDPDFACIINNPKYLLKEPIKISGFYYESAIKVIRGGIKKKMEQLIERGYADPIDNLDEGLDQAIEKEIARKKNHSEPIIKPETIDELDHNIIDSKDIIDSQDIMESQDIDDKDMDDDDDDDDDEIEAVISNIHDDDDDHENRNDHMDWELNI